MKPMTLRLPDDLQTWLVAEAKAEGRSLNGHIVWIFQQRRAVAAFVVGAPSPNAGPEEQREVHQPDTIVIPHTLASDTSVVSSPLDAVLPDSKKGKASSRRWASGKQTLKVSPAFDSAPTSLCTCGPGERAKGRHNKYCPMRGK